MKYTIRNVELKNNLVLAPMAGITDPAFRIICKRFGAGLIYTEMVNANAIVRNNKSSIKKMQFSEEEKPVTIQLFGAKTELLVKAAKYAESLGCDIIDLNLGCPDPNVINQGAGSALMKRPKKIFEIISSMVKAVKIPITAKMRIFDNEEKTLKLAKIIESAGASALAVHGRTIEQGYTGKANWNMIKKVKETVKIPVILSGDIFSAKDALKALEETKVDFLMIGRGIIGRPYLFQEIQETLKDKKYEISDKEKISSFFEYEKLAEKYSLKFADIKRQAMNFTKCIIGSAKLRDKISRTKNIEEIKELMS